MFFSAFQNLSPKGPPGSFSNLPKNLPMQSLHNKTHQLSNERTQGAHYQRGESVHEHVGSVPFHGRGRGVLTAITLGLSLLMGEEVGILTSMNMLGLPPLMGEGVGQSFLATFAHHSLTHPVFSCTRRDAAGKNKTAQSNCYAGSRFLCL